MLSCDEALQSSDSHSKWDLQANGQLKLRHAGEHCLSQGGPAPGKENVAAKAAVMASSAADVIVHGASMAVDNSETTYWASRLDDTKELVTFTIDFGGQRKLEYAQIVWEFPAKAFTISLSQDGIDWSECFSTDLNLLNTTHVPLGYQYASMARVTMHEPHPIYGRFQGHRLYGIKSLAFYSSRLTSVMSDCGKAAKSSDARDKYFMASVAEFDPYPSTSLRGELTSLEAAQLSLAAITGELLAVLPQLASCNKGSGLFQKLSSNQSVSPGILSPQRHMQHEGPYTGGLRGHPAGGLTSSFVSSIGALVPGTQAALIPIQDLVDAINGIDVDAISLLIREARVAIMAVRKVLK